MIPRAFACAVSLSLLVACGGGDKPANSSASTGSTKESCRALVDLVCKSGGGQSSICQNVSAAVSVLPPSSCVEALKEPELVTSKVAALQESCRTLTTRLCNDLGEKTAACAMVNEQSTKFDAPRCQAMLEHYDEVLVDLRAYEKEHLPLGLDDQKAIAASDAPSFGPADAKVTVVLFSDFECPYCAKAAEAANHLKANYSNKIRFVFRQFPLEFHKRAKLAAEASLVAQASGKFWEYHDQLFANQDHLDADALTNYARAVGLDPVRFREQMTAHTFEQKVQVDLDLGERVSVRGTPTLFINGKRSSNATSAEVVASEVEAALAE